MKKLLIIGLLLLLLLLPLVSALSCDYNDAPFMVGDGNPSALCVVSSSVNTACYTFLSDPVNSSFIWGGMPSGEVLDGVGRLDYYVVNNGVVSVDFSRVRLYDNVSVTGNVVCGGESTSFNFTPRFFNYDVVPEGFGWGISNSAYVVFFFFLGIIIFISLSLVWGLLR